MNELVSAALKEFKSLRDRKAEMERGMQEIQHRMQELETFLKIADTIQPQKLVEYSEETRMPTLKDQVLSATQRMLRGGIQMQTRDIVQELERQGIKLPGGTPAGKVLRVSLLLSREKEKFVADRTNGWSLKSVDGDEKEEAEAGTSASVLRRVAA